MKAALYIVPTPIGNIGDITLRALEILKAVDLIAAEDTRHSRTLMTHYDISTPLVSFHEHSENRVVEQLADRVAGGESIALISDAGTPLVSDPGYALVRGVQARGLNVIPLPGACAAITALSAAGLPTHHFHFEGFLPAKQVARVKRLEAIKSLNTTVIFYEAPHRIVDLITDMLAVFGVDHEICLARELTKTFETIRRAPLGDIREWVLNDANQQKGEFVVISGLVVQTTTLGADGRLLLERLAAELPPRKAAQIVADHYGLKSRDLYQQLIAD
ncbi:MAG: 16S rRNA (cytidine(1402)-2'-O)-methyltransferase [Luminiphilus sp.]|nr:16S rRNA (cytidine(1402)-2'-O)-methyltransferase [Luminiphilus sp.]